MNDADFKIYGQWVFGENANQFPVGRILGCRALRDEHGKPDLFEVQISAPDKTGRVAVLQFSYSEAMALLSCLKSSQLDEGFPFPDDPRGR